MRMPKLREMTAEQKAVYLYAPNDAHVLVSGPPGTGKTVIAALRAAELKKRGVPVALGMYSRVLVKYAAGAPGDDSEALVRTVFEWFREWWNAAELPPHPAGGPICVELPFKDKDAVKAAGARWHEHQWRPWQQRTGTWVVDYDVWAKAPERFSGWRLWQSAPCVPEAEDQIDWKAVYDHVMEHDEDLSDASLSVGTLLIDEGQDFAPWFYKLLGLLAVIGASRPTVSHPLKCFVLADENQQLTEYNSTLNEIQAGLKIAPKNRFPPLLDNFRNTHEIAEVARAFFDDVSALPRLPTRRGERPLYTEGIPSGDCVQQILTWIINHPGKNAGVLVFKEQKRDALQKALSKAVGGIEGRTVSVQSYSWETRKANRVENLVFDVPDVISVLNMRSCKGLEFDAVFIVDLHDAQIGLYGASRFRMQMFVAVSRAREWVQLLETQKDRSTAPFYAELPSSAILPRETWKKALPPARAVRQIPAVPVQERKAALEDWETWARAFARKRGCANEDLRPRGCFWLYAPAEDSAELTKRGFQYSARRQGWWRT